MHPPRNVWHENGKNMNNSVNAQISINHTKTKTAIKTPFITETPFWQALMTVGSFELLIHVLTSSGASWKKRYSENTPDATLNKTWTVRMAKYARMSPRFLNIAPIILWNQKS